MATVKKTNGVLGGMSGMGGAPVTATPGPAAPKPAAPTKTNMPGLGGGGGGIRPAPAPGGRGNGAVTTGLARVTKPAKPINATRPAAPAKPTVPKATRAQRVSGVGITIDGDKRAKSKPKAAAKAVVGTPGKSSSSIARFGATKEVRQAAVRKMIGRNA